MLAKCVGSAAGWPVSNAGLCFLNFKYLFSDSSSVKVRMVVLILVAVSEVVRARWGQAVSKHRVSISSGFH